MNEYCRCRQKLQSKSPTESHTHVLVAFEWRYYDASRNVGSWRQHNGRQAGRQRTCVGFGYIASVRKSDAVFSFQFSLLFNVQNLFIAYFALDFLVRSL